MRIEKSKLLIAMANSCMNPKNLCDSANISYQTYQRMLKHNAKPATIGKIARVLNVDVTELIED
ncbi:helix-turn-helix domain-containing protein [Clostridium sp. Marseille-P299]|uniref:helix-turn-helix domain-containing protein n=1 Tax=Clostridium sp. Marseille-P299 TaxID=1805477 RepID=UPI00082B3F31|nr:helix-turn-helix domain-containing protein [Clostridium sp. Marseille-P299]